MRDFPPVNGKSQAIKPLSDGREVITDRPGAADQEVRDGKMRLSDKGAEHSPHGAKGFIYPQRVRYGKKSGRKLHNTGDPPGPIGIKGHNIGKGIGQYRHCSRCGYR